MKLKKLLGNQSHWTINKEMAREIGLNNTVILQHLIDWSTYHNKQTIFQTYEQIQTDLGLSEHAVKRIGIPELRKRGFISTERKGIGYKIHYTVNEDAIIQFLSQPSREVNTTPLSSSDAMSPISKVNTPSLIGESTLRISNNIPINNVDEEYIAKQYINKQRSLGVPMNKLFSQSLPSSQELEELNQLIK